MFDGIVASVEVLLSTTVSCCYSYSLLLTNFKSRFQRIYNLGARKFAFIGTGPIGCCPSLRKQNKTEGCNPEANYMSVQYNKGVASLLQNMAADFGDMSYSFFDTSLALLEYIQQPATYGTKTVPVRRFPVSISHELRKLVPANLMFPPWSLSLMKIYRICRGESCMLWSGRSEREDRLHSDLDVLRESVGPHLLGLLPSDRGHRRHAYFDCIRRICALRLSYEYKAVGCSLIWIYENWKPLFSMHRLLPSCKTRLKYKKINVMSTCMNIDRYTNTIHYRKNLWQLQQQFCWHEFNNLLSFLEFSFFSFLKTRIGC